MQKITTYIKHCDSCQRNTTSRSKPNGNLQPIQVEARPFATTTIDFVMRLPEIPAVSPWKLEGFDTFDSLMSVTDKFSKKILLIPGHSTYTAENWAEIF